MMKKKNEKLAIVDIIRLYGLNSRKLSPKYPIKYQTVIKSLKEKFSRNSLDITDIVDNKCNPNKSKAHHCQIESCHKRIRFEYTVTDKNTKKSIVVGSTCVGTLMGLSKLEMKTFKRFENSLKKHNDLLMWKEEHADVVSKVELLYKHYDFYEFKPFYDWLLTRPLMNKDIAYIKSINVHKLLRDREEAEKRKAEKKQLKKIEANKWIKWRGALMVLLLSDPSNSFYRSLLKQLDAYHKLSLKQVRCIMVDTDKVWYNTKIRGSDRDLWKESDMFMYSILKKYNIKKPRNFRYSTVDEMNNFVSDVSAVPMNDRERWLWELYRVRNGVVFVTADTVKA